jgi:hypothetical protein
MAGEYQVLSTLNRMLESRERKEQTRMSRALAMMEFAQQKKMQDYQLASNQLAVLQQANQQIQANEAQQFLSDIGIGAYDLTNFEEGTEHGGVDAARDYLTNKIKSKKGINVGGLGLSDIQANEMITAAQAAQAGNYKPILGLASDLSDLADKRSTNVGLTKQESKFLDAFEKGIGYFDDVDYARKRLGSVKKSVQNADEIIEEQFELAKGDTTIRESLSSYSTDDLADAADEMDEMAPIVGKPEEELQKVKTSLEQLNTDIFDKNQSIVQMNEELESLDMLEKSGTLTEEQLEYKKRIPQIRKNLENDLLELSDKIDKNKSLERMIEENQAQKRVDEATKEPVYPTDFSRWLHR